MGETEGKCEILFWNWGECFIGSGGMDELDAPGWVDGRVYQWGIVNGAQVLAYMQLGGWIEGGRRSLNIYLALLTGINLSATLAVLWPMSLPHVALSDKAMKEEFWLMEMDLQVLCFYPSEPRGEGALLMLHTSLDNITQ